MTLYWPTDPSYPCPTCGHSAAPPSPARCAIPPQMSGETLRERVLEEIIRFQCEEIAPWQLADRMVALAERGVKCERCGAYHGGRGDARCGHCGNKLNQAGDVVQDRADDVADAIASKVAARVRELLDWPIVMAETGLAAIVVDLRSDIRAALDADAPAAPAERGEPMQPETAALLDFMGIPRAATHPEKCRCTYEVGSGAEIDKSGCTLHGIQ